VFLVGCKKAGERGKGEWVWGSGGKGLVYRLLLVAGGGKLGKTKREGRGF